ncbi:MAG TPA: adenylate/guanylate cyclase domain-containing protein [Candidatus Binatia bacterium]
MSRLGKTILFALLVAAIGVVASFLDLAHELEENSGLGLLFRLRGAKPAPAEVVIISIDRESSDHLGVHENPDRWPRSLHARLIEKLAEEGAKVITFDVYFVDPSSSTEDNLLAEAIRKAGNVVLAEQLKAKDISASNDTGVFTGPHRIVESKKPIFPVSRHAVATAPFVLPKLPVKVNQYWAFQTAAGDSPTFPIVAFQLYALTAYDEFFRLLERADPVAARTLPPNNAGALQARGAVRFIREIRSIFESEASMATRMSSELEGSDLASRDPSKYALVKSLINMYGGADHRYLNYYGPPRSLRTVPFYQVLQSREISRGERPINFKGKAVFVGLSEIALTERKDSFYTAFSRPDGVFLSGAEIAATAFSNLLQNAPVTPVGPPSFVVVVFFWGLLVALIGRMASTVAAALGIAAVSSIYLIAAKYLFQADGTWYPIIIPLFIQSPLALGGAVLLNYFETNRERQNIRKALSYYVPDEVVDHLAENIADMRRDSQTLYGVCLFTDCAGYTTVSETMGARELSDFMHRYFVVIFEPIKQNGGFVVDLKGDAVVAVWRGAQADAALCRKACHAALDVAKAVRRFNETLENFKLLTRISVHAGEIFLGNIGAADHYQYGVTGDTVNTASRMDGLNKYLGTEILVSDEVIHEVEGFLTREAGTFLLKGKAQPIRVYQLLSRTGEAEETQRKACAIFAEGLCAFRCRSWSQAKAKFQQSAEFLQDDQLPAFYLTICERYEKQPPDGTWKGFVELEEK